MCGLFYYAPPDEFLVDAFITLSVSLWLYVTPNLVKEMNNSFTKCFISRVYFDSVCYSVYTAYNVVSDEPIYSLVSQYTSD